MKKQIYWIASVGIGAIVMVMIGISYFAGYGANNCDVPGKKCDCFCCNWFNLRGYESCGDFGLITGIIFGGITGIAIYKLIRRSAI